MRWPPLVAALHLALGAGCGYRPIYGGGAPQRLHVTPARTLVPDAVASDEVVSGLREELAREDALESGAGWPRVEVEVLRADEDSEGIVASGPTGSRVPRARGVAVGVVARAWVASGPDAPPERETGDMRSEDVIALDDSASGLDLRATGFHTSDALRAAARRLGAKLGRKLLGMPAGSEGE